MTDLPKTFETFVDDIYKINGQNNLLDTFMNQDVTSSDDFLTEYAFNLMPFMTPIVYGAILTLFIFFFVILNWCCMYGICSPFDCCRLWKKPKETSKKNLCSFLVLLTIMSLCFVSIQQVLYTIKNPLSIHNSLDDISNLIEKINTGDNLKESTKWQGINSLQEYISTLENTQQLIKKKMNSILTDIHILKSDLGTSTNGLQQIIDEFSIEVWYNPKAFSTTIYMPWQFTILGPLTSPSSTLGSVNNGVNSIITAIKDQEHLFNIMLSVVGNLDMAPIRTMIATQSSMLTKAKNSVLEFKGETTVYASYFKLFRVVLFGLILLIVGVSTLSIAMLRIFQIKWLNIALHSSWCLLLLIIPILWCASFVLVPSSVILLEGCDMLDFMLSSEDSFKTIATTIKTQTDTDISLDGLASACLFKKDSLTNSLAGGLDLGDEAMQQISTLEANLVLYAKELQQNSLTTGINQIIGMLSMEQEGTRFESIDQMEAVDFLNKVIACDTSIQDIWVLHSDNCPSDYMIFSGTDPKFNRGSATCISINDWILLASDSVAVRYAPYFAGTECPNVNSRPIQMNVEEAVSRLSLNKQDRDHLTGRLIHRFNQIKTAYIASFDAFLLRLATDEEVDLSGLSTQLKLDCSFLGSDLQNLNTKFCNSFVSEVFPMSLILVCVSMFGLFAFVAIFCLAKRILI